jgi:NADH-ubiquinone oxidoreductase chain 2
MFESSKNYVIISLLIFLIISNALTTRKDKTILFSRNAMLALTFTFLLIICNSDLTIYDRGIGIYNGLFHINSTTMAFNVFILIITSIILILTSFFPRRNISLSLLEKGDKNISSLQNLINNFYSVFNNKNTKLSSSHLMLNEDEVSNKKSEQFRIIEYSLIIVFVINGAILLMSSNDLVSIFLSIELQSYALYIISTIYRDSEQATSGGLTYFLLGGLSSCFILLGSSLLYINSGTTNIDGIYIISLISNFNTVAYNQIINIYSSYYIEFSLIILSVGFLFKISAAPFHFWSPDVYDAIPTVVTTFVAIVAKISIFIFFLELVFYTANLNKETLDTQSILSWNNTLLVSSLFSLIIGSVLGLTQSRIKRLFAYSTISHVGFILLALSVNTVESIQAYFFYIIAYTISNLNAFIILLSIGYSLYLYVYNTSNSNNNDGLNNADNYSPIQLISQLKGYFYINPYLALSITITLFSFVGVPPLIGFFAKQMVLSAALDNGFVFMTLIAILTSVIGAVYYLNIIKQVFFYKSDYVINSEYNDTKDTNNTNNNKIALSSGLSISISILTLILLLFIYIPNEWFRLANILTLILFKL